jgi:type IV pilus assembly protein PilC
MLFSELPLASLIEFCRVMRHNLSAGLTLRHVFRQQASRGPAAIRPVAARISEQLEEGSSLEAALKPERHKFPPLFVSLAVVGEQTGNLPEVLVEVEKYFVLVQRLRRDFVRQIAWPALQFFMVPFVLAGMILLLSILSQGTKPWDPLGFGLTGPSGALAVIVGFFGTLAFLVVLYLLITRTLKHQATVDEILLRIPVIGPCLTALALTRFCLALRLTMETGMPITQAIRLSMRGTGNAAFASHADVVRDALKEGEELSSALGKCRLFPTDFIDILANAEEGGRVPEVMRHQAEHYEEESRRYMTILTRAASWGFYAFVAGLIVFMIFRILFSYISLIDEYSAPGFH